MKKGNISPLRRKLYHIIFEAETPAGKAFDIFLLIIILLSVLTVALESVEELRKVYGAIFFWAEVTFTIFFTFEYFLRIYSAPKPLNYIFSFLGW